MEIKEIIELTNNKMIICVCQKTAEQVEEILRNYAWFNNSVVEYGKIYSTLNPPHRTIRPCYGEVPPINPNNFISIQFPDKTLKIKHNDISNLTSISCILKENDLSDIENYFEEKEN